MVQRTRGVAQGEEGPREGASEVRRLKSGAPGARKLRGEAPEE